MRTDHAIAHQVGDRIGEYELTGRLGIGATAEVWCARHLPTGRRDALKLLRTEDAEVRQRFVAEIRLLASIRHPGVVRLFAHGTAEDGQPWLAMELLEPLPEVATESEVRRWALQLCDAAEELHRHGVLHRDIKRSNVMLRGRHAVLVDFGIAKPLSTSVAQALMTLPHPTLIGEPHGVGTPGRSAPEQFEGAALSAAADVYAIGMLVRDLLPEWQRFPLWRRVMAKVLVADPALRCPTPRALGKLIGRASWSPWLMGAVRWLLPWVVVGAVFAYGPVMNWLRVRGWVFQRSLVVAQEETALAPRTVYSAWALREEITEMALPDNPGGVVWCGRFDFKRSDTYQRLILWSPTLGRKTVIGHFRVGTAFEHEVVLVGDIDFICTDVYGFIRYPSPTHSERLGKPFSETWLERSRPYTSREPVTIRHVATLSEARALPPPKRPTVSQRPYTCGILRLKGQDTLDQDTYYPAVTMRAAKCEVRLPQNRTGVVWLNVSDDPSKPFVEGGRLVLVNPGPKPLTVVGAFRFASRPMRLILVGDIRLHDVDAEGAVSPTSERLARPFDDAWIDARSKRSPPAYVLERSAEVPE